MCFHLLQLLPFDVCSKLEIVYAPEIWGGEQDLEKMVKLKYFENFRDIFPCYHLLLLGSSSTLAAIIPGIGLFLVGLYRMKMISKRGAQVVSPWLEE